MNAGPREYGRDLSVSGLNFFGRISASVTHELNNVLAIIEQTGGLLEDLLASHPEGQPIAREQLEKIAGRIEEQSARGTEIVKRLNMFAHSIDESEVSFEVGSTIENLCALTERLAGLKRVSLTARTEEPLTLVGNPFGFQQGLFLAIQLCLLAAQEGDTITITSERLAPGLAVHVEGCGAAPDPAVSDLFARLMTSQNGRVDVRAEAGRLRFDLLFAT
jgi:C4-dicarboxylate-specific signal transduction histidine kinase